MDEAKRTGFILKSPKPSKDDQISSSMKLKSKKRAGSTFEAEDASMGLAMEPIEPEQFEKKAADVAGGPQAAPSPANSPNKKICGSTQNTKKQAAFSFCL